MFEIYEFNGKKFKVSPNKKEDFLIKYPEAVLTTGTKSVRGQVRETELDRIQEGKQTSSAIDAATEQKTSASSQETSRSRSNTDLNLEYGSLESLELELTSKKKLLEDKDYELKLSSIKKNINKARIAYPLKVDELVGNYNDLLESYKKDTKEYNSTLLKYEKAFKRNDLNKIKDMSEFNERNRDKAFDVLNDESALPLPKFLSSWMVAAASRVVGMAKGGVTAYNSEKITEGLLRGETLDDIINKSLKGDGDLSTMSATALYHFGQLEKELNGFARKEYDEETGEELNVVDLIEKGRISDAGGLAAEQAVSNIASLAITAINPVVGAATIGVTSYGQEFESEVEKLPIDTVNEETLNTIKKASFLKAGAEFGGELVGGKLFRAAAGMVKSGATKEVVKEFSRSYTEKFAKGLIQGGGGEFLSEAMTSVMQDGVDVLMYGDEKSFTDFFRGALNNGLIGATLGGPTAAVSRSANNISRSDLNKLIAPRQWQITQAKLNEDLVNAENNLENADNRTKDAYQRRVDTIKKKIQRQNDLLNSVFDNKTQAELESYAETIDQVNKQMDIAFDGSASIESRDEAKEEIINLNKKLNEDTNGFVNAELEASIGRILKAREVINSRKGIRGFGKDLNIKYLSTDEQVKEALKESNVDASDKDGVFMDGETKTIYINERVASQTLQSNVLGHELLHYMMSKNFKTDNASMRPLVDSFKKYLIDTDNQSAIDRIEKRMKDNGYMDSSGNIKEGNLEEYFNMFSDIVDKGLVKSDESKSSSIAKSFTDLLVGLGFKSVQLNTGKDVFDFIKTYNKNVNRKGLLGELTRRRVIKTKLESSKLDKAISPQQVTKMSKDVQPEVDDLGAPMGWDNETWKSGGSAFALSEMQNNKMFDGLIAAKLKVPMSYSDTQEFIQKVYAELTSHVNNFKPESNDSLFGWVNSQIANKAGNVYNREYKATEESRAVDIDATTSEGAPVIQIEADTDAEMQRIDEIGLSETEVEERSKLRREIRLDDKMINTVKNAVVKTFGTKLPEVESKKFRTALEKAFRTELKKPIQDLMGGRSDYDLFLRNHSKAIFKALPVETLVQMERNLKPEQRIFTESRRITKPVEVDKLVSEGKLPKDTNRLSGPQLHTKKPFPGVEKMMAFYRGKDMESVLGYKVSGSTLGTRKDKLAMEMGVELAFDATSEVLQQPDVQEKRRMILELQGFQQVKDELPVIGKQINRDPNVKFSQSVLDLQNIGSNIREVFELETKGVDKLLNFFSLDSTFKMSTEGDVNIYVQEVIKNLLPLMPRDFWFGKPNSKGNYGTVFTPSSKVLGAKNKKLYKDYYEPQMKALRNLPDSAFGKPIDGVKDFSKSSYSTLFKNEATIKENIANGNIKKFNDKVSKIHRALWSRINDAISKDKSAAIVIGNYLKITASDTSHWHKLGAQFIGYSKNPKLRYEFEHAMPATSAYIYLMDAALSGYNFKGAYDLVIENYKLIALDKYSDVKLTKGGLQRRMPEGWSVLHNSWWQRYFNDIVSEIDGGIDPDSIIMLDGKTIGQSLNINKSGGPSIVKMSKSSLDTRLLNNKILNNYIKYSKSGEAKGMSTFDFDETLIIDGENFILAKDPSTGEEITISSGDWPIKGPELAASGYEFDFSDFVNVRGGVDGPLLQKMKNQVEKYGPDNVFVLTARMQEAAKPIHGWLKSKGINIPLENITGLGKSQGEAKGEWMLQKYAEGYNDMYFVDDALPNVRAVKQVLDALDIKSKVVQARIKFSKTASQEFNEMLERNKGVDADTTFDAVEATLRGAKRGKFAFFIPPSAEDFKGLMYKFLGKGKQGDADLKWFGENLFKPFSKGVRQLDSVKQAMTEEYTALKKAYPDVVRSLNNKVGGTEFTVDNAIRVFLWDKAGFEVPGISDKNKKMLLDYVNSSESVTQFASILGGISRRPDGYIKPKEYWVTQSIASDLVDVVTKVNRAEYLAEWIENKNLVFSKENLNKIESIYGSKYRDALEAILFRMETGTNRPVGNDRTVNNFLNWINGSVGAVMFFNSRSAVLQTLSTVNFLNFEDNNIFAAAKAFANQKQFWKDFATIYNSDMLKQRRAGLKIDVSASELTEAFAQGKNKAQAAIAYLLQLGFTPTQVADSFAISMGGSTYYRNRVSKYLKEGKSQKDAEDQAFLDFQEIAEETQQSSRPDLISQQQSSTLGRLILAWANTPMQMTRLTKKALSDIVNGRGDFKANMSRVIYYGVAQNIIFGTLQTALMFTLFGSDEEDEKATEEKKKKELRVANGVMDTLLRGTGVYGAAVATIKNTLMKWNEERQKPYGRKDLSKITQEIINLSPPIGTKVRKIMSAIKTYDYNKDVMKKMDHGINNPKWNVFANIIEATTNAPAARLLNKANNLKEAANTNNELWQRVGLALGWDKWSLGVKDQELEEAKKEVKEERKQESKDKAKKKREEKKKQKAKEDEAKGIKKVRCRAKKSDGRRCKNYTTNKNKRCYAHQ